MTTRATVCVLAILILAAAASASDTGNRAPNFEKVSQPTGKPTYEGRDPGDTIEDPLVIDNLPFIDSGDTCPFAHDYDEVCPYTFSASPDVVYRYDCTYTTWVTIDLCASQYDTKVFVYENGWTHGSPLVCNDDFPGCGPNGYQSWAEVEFEQGNTYYIVVDGYTSDCGIYELYIQDYPPCVHCPPNSYVEPEPECIDPENDIWNGGCNSDPPVFDYLQPGEGVVSFCGTSGTYTQSGSSWRDTDWYQIDLATESEITLRCIANFWVRIGFVDGREGCVEFSSFYSYADAPQCSVAGLTELLPAGTWWIWVGPIDFTGIPCGEMYECEITGYSPATAVDDASWSVIKTLYR